MIIRSLSRKTESFRQLYNYINRDQTIPYSILWNLNTHNPYHQKKILEQFYENSALLAKGKRRNFLYHDIISVTLQPDVPMDQQMQALRDIALKYIQGRGSNLLAYGRMHLEGKNLHIHLMLSANELENEKRHYLSKSAFADVQKQCEQYMQQRYPELNQPVIFCKERTEKPNKSRQREYEYTKRTGKKTKKQQVKEMLADLLEQERSQPLKSHLGAHGFQLYQRGKHVGVIYDGTKYRLGTLGLRDAFTESLSRPVKKTQSSPERESSQSDANTPAPSQTETETETRTQSNMNRIYEEMEKQERALQDIETQFREFLDEQFGGDMYAMYREGKTIHMKISERIFSLSLEADELSKWASSSSPFTDADLEATIKKIDRVFYEIETSTTKQQTKNQTYVEPELDL